MIVPIDIKPEYSLYFIGGQLLETIKNHNKISFDLIELYHAFMKRIDDCSFNQYLLALDWLYLIDVVEIDNKGQLKKCF